LDESSSYWLFFFLLVGKVVLLLPFSINVLMPPYTTYSDLGTLWDVSMSGSSGTWNGRR